MVVNVSPTPGLPQEGPRRRYLNALTHRWIQNSFQDLAHTLAQVPSQPQLASGVRVFEPTTATRVDTTELFLIGTGSYCNLKFQSRYVSRVQLVILPVKDWYFLVDVGSTNGTLVTFSNEQQPEQQVTLNQAYPVWKFPKETFVRLDLIADGVSPVYLNWKFCVVCETQPRNFRSPCGHAWGCVSCSLNWPMCPICRTPSSETPEASRHLPNLTYIKPA